MVDQKLQQLVLPLGQVAFASVVADQLPLWIQLQSLKLPQTPIPKVEPRLIATHLTLDDAEVTGGRILGDRAKLRQLPAHPVQEADLEPNQVSVDTDPVPGILPMRRPQVLALQTSGVFWTQTNHPHQMLPAATVATTSRASTGARIGPRPAKAWLLAFVNGPRAIFTAKSWLPSSELPSCRSSSVH